MRRFQSVIRFPWGLAALRFRAGEHRACAGPALPAALAAALALAATAHAQAPRSLNDLTGPWHLFVDDHAIQSKTGVSRVYHPFTKYANNPVMIADRPWEGRHIYVYGTALHNESGPGYRLWYHALSNDPDRTHNLYATSPDGINWTKPNLGIVSYNGSTNNNFYIRRGGGDHILSVIHTPWEANPGRRYKLINFDGATSRFLGAWSADGLHWTDATSNPIIPPASDVANFAWDPHNARYNGYLKMNSYVRNLRRRSVGFTCSTEFNTLWPTHYLILEPDDFDDRWATGVQRTHFYGLCAFPYETMYLGFLWIFRATDPEGYYDGVIFVELVTSHDGVNWQRQEGNRPPILPLGPAGSWDDGMVFTTQHPLVESDTIKLWYGGSSGTHASFINDRTSIGLATLRKDGFASLDAGTSSGTILTRRLLNAQGPLRLNYAASAGGSVRVEVTDELGAAIPGYSLAHCTPLTGNSTSEAVAWGGQTQLPTEPAFTRLRFVLQKASLYSFMAGDSAQVIAPPAISQQPQSIVASTGQTVQFSVAATGYGPLTYRWQKSGVAFSDGGRYSGAATPTLTISNVTNAEVAAYSCAVSNVAGTTVSKTATLTFPNYSQLPPTITAHPGPLALRVGQPAVLSVAVSSSAPLSYVWFKNDQPLAEGGQYAGTATATLIVSPVKTGDLGNYRCLVINSAGETLSDPAALTIHSFGDFDGDEDLDLEDFARFQVCLSGPGVEQADPACDAARLDNDWDVDQADLSIFRRCMTSPGTPIQPTCID